MEKIFLSVALLLSAAVTTQAVAGPKWNQLSLSYLSASADSEEITGFGVSGTKLLGSNFFLVGSYATFSEDVSGSVDADLNFLSLGIGARRAVAANTDIFGVISYENTELALSSGFISESLGDVDGFSVSAGIRSMVTPKFELSGSVSYAEFDDIDETGFDIGMAYHFTNQFAAGIGYGTAEDVDTLSLSGTFNF